MATATRNNNESIGTADWTETIEKYRVAFIAGTVALLMGVLAVGFIVSKSSDGNSELDKLIFEFKKGPLASYIKDGKDAAPLIQGVNQLLSESGSYGGSGAVLIQSVNALLNKEKSDEAYSLLKENVDRFSSVYLSYLLKLRLASLAENKGNKDEAVQILEGLLTSPLKIMEGKIYLDLGRLYLEKGDAQKAETHFRYVMDNEKDPELVKLARLYYRTVKN